MCAIFKWLNKCHVKKVLKVTVIDNQEPSHSDEAIEECVSGLDVRTWNWYKTDLCSEILQCVPNVRDVTLYSSGSNAVLLGWSSSAGLAQLKQVSAPSASPCNQDSNKSDHTARKGAHLCSGSENCPVGKNLRKYH